MKGMIIFTVDEYVGEPGGHERGSEPKDMDAVTRKRVRRVKGALDIIQIPEMATALKKNVVIPPRTASGIDAKAAANLEKTRRG